MPGVYAANIAIGRLSQYSELGVRRVDVGALALLLGITFGILRRFGRLAGGCAAIYVGILYLASGEFLSPAARVPPAASTECRHVGGICAAFAPRRQSAHRGRPSWSRRDDQAAGDAGVRSPRRVDCLHARHA